MKKIIFLILLIITSTVIAAPTCSVNGTKVIYTNGVNTSKENTRNALKKIEVLLGLDSAIDERFVEYSVVYNFNKSFALDLLEATIQRIPQSFIESVSAIDAYGAYLQVFTTNILGEFFPVELLEIINEQLEIYKQFKETYNLNQENVELIRAAYDNSLSSGYRVLAISHSQGGLFMEDAYDLIQYTSKELHFAGTQVATPVLNNIIPKFNYVLHDQDHLIGMITKTIGTLPPNITAPDVIHNEFQENLLDYVTDYALNHGMESTYLYVPIFKDAVRVKIIESAGLLESNCPIAVIKETVNGLTVDFDSTNPSDPLFLSMPYVYSWDFGDGISVQTSSKTISHTYNQAGTYTVSLRVTDLENRDFGSISVKQKTIILQQNIIGCGSETGTYHINPDGTMGGFVSNTAYVASTVTIDFGIQVCGTSQIIGNSRISKSSVYPSDFYLPKYRGFYISNSTIIDSTLIANTISVYASTISNSYINSTYLYESSSSLRDSMINTKEVDAVKCSIYNLLYENSEGLFKCYFWTGAANGILNTDPSYLRGFVY